MALLDLLKHRKSVRHFLARPVEREKIMMCLEAARLAPSACNSQPWKFIVVDDRQLKNKLCDAAFGGIYSMNSFCKMAPVIVVIIFEKPKFLAKIGGMFRGTKYYLIDIGIAGLHSLERKTRFELATSFLARKHSTAELLPPFHLLAISSFSISSILLVSKSAISSPLRIIFVSSYLYIFILTSAP